MSSSTDSTASLTSKDKTSVPHKAYAATQADHQSKHEAGDNALMPTSGSPPKYATKELAKSATSEPADPEKGAAKSNEDREGGESTTSKSTTKNYEAAFATLQSEYGFGGSAPVIPRR